MTQQEEHAIHEGFCESVSITSVFLLQRWNQKAAAPPSCFRDPNHVPVTCSHVGPAADGCRGVPPQPASRLGRGGEQPESRHQWKGRRPLLHWQELQETGHLQRHLRPLLHRLQGSHIFSQGALERVLTCTQTARRSLAHMWRLSCILPLSTGWGGHGSAASCRVLAASQEVWHHLHRVVVLSPGLHPHANGAGLVSSHSAGLDHPPLGGLWLDVQQWLVTPFPPESGILWERTQDWDNQLFSILTHNNMRQRTRFTFLYTVIFIYQYMKYGQSKI